MRWCDSVSVMKGILIEKFISIIIHLSTKIPFITDMLPHHRITYKDVAFGEY